MIIRNVPLSDGNVFDNTEKIIKEHKDFYSGDPDKIKEIECLESELSRSKAEFLLCCLGSVTICNVDGLPFDEWDGVIMSLSDDAGFFAIYETKNKGVKSVQEAFKQLNDTKKFLNSDILSQARRRRIKGVGAKLLIK